MFMKLVLAAVLALSFTSAAVSKDVYVKPHIRKDGTYVDGHYRTAPDNSKFDNYSTRGNVNPYTGQDGTVDPYKIEPMKPVAPQPLPKTCYKDFNGKNVCY
jgi:opacity protein-like surface antigen